MTTMFVRHTVSDYKTWRKVYDDFASVQKTKGVTAEAVYRAVENPNDITVTHEFATIEAAQAFAESAELKNAMQNAGVAKAPTISIPAKCRLWWYHVACWPIETCRSGLTISVHRGRPVENGTRPK